MINNKKERYEFIIKNIKSRDFSITKKKDILMNLHLKDEISLEEYSREFVSLIYEINDIFKIFKKNLSIVNELSFKDPDGEYELIMEYIKKFIIARKQRDFSNYKHEVLNDKVVDTVLNIQDIELNKKQGLKLGVK